MHWNCLYNSLSEFNGIKFKITKTTIEEKTLDKTIQHWVPSKEITYCSSNMGAGKPVVKSYTLSKYVETVACIIGHNKNLCFIVLWKSLSTALEETQWNWNSVYLSCNNDWASWQTPIWWPHGFWSRCRNHRDREAVPISYCTVLQKEPSSA